MRVMAAAPSIDLQNPLYCPAVSAASYLMTLRNQFRLGHAPANIPHRRSRQRSRAKFDANVAVSSFTRLLGKALLKDNNNSLQTTRKTRSQTTATNIEFILDPDTYIPPLWEASGSSSSSLSSAVLENRKSLSHANINLRRKRKLSCTNDVPHRSAKHTKSISISLSEPDEPSLFIPLNFTSAPINHMSPPQKTETHEMTLSTEEKLIEKVRTLEEFLYGPQIGPESPRGMNLLIQRLDSILPGIRLKNRLCALPLQSHQGLADYLGDYGLLNPRIMSILRTSEIRSLSLSDSLDEEDGLNIDGRDIFPIFSKPNSFIFLTYLSFSGTRVHDFDLVHIQHLPRLAILLLDNTTIGNEAVYLLTSLKRSLTYLTVSTNPDINNDAVPALLLLSKLGYLSILDTNIDMIGLRRLAYAIDKEGRIIDVEIPESCDHYIESIEFKYLVKLDPPLIKHAILCEKLSEAALRRNLEAHAACNPNIVTSGTKEEMKDRLQNLLQTREMDMLVATMVMGED